MELTLNQALQKGVEAHKAGQVQEAVVMPTESLNFMREVLPKEWLSFRDQVTDNFRIISHHNVRILQ